MHEWYVVGSHESDIGKIDGWADLKLECINDHDCKKTASIMINIQSSKIKEEDDK